MTDIPEPVDNDELGWGFVVVLALCVIAGLTIVPWALAQGLLWVVDTGGWLRFGVGAAVAAAGAAYVVRLRRHR